MTKQALLKAIEAHKAGDFREAGELYISILESEPNHPDANHNMGILAIGAGRFEQALSFLRRAIDANPAVDQFWLSLIGLLIKLEKVEDAQKVFLESKDSGREGELFNQVEARLNNLVLKKSKSDTKLNLLQEHLAPVLALYRQGRFQEVLDQVDELKSKFPSSPDLHNICGAANAALRNYEAALNNYKRALKIKPDFAEAHNNLGNTLKSIGNLNSAISHYEKALKIDPKYAEAYYNIANAFKDKKNFVKAKYFYNRAIKIKSDYENAYINLASIYKAEGDLNHAYTIYKQAVNLNPDNAIARNNMGTTEMAFGNLHSAKEHFEHSIKINPKYFEALINLGTALKESGDLNGAMIAFKRALNLKPNSEDVFYRLGLLMQKKGELVAAEKYLGKALEIMPERTDILHVFNSIKGKTTNSAPDSYVEMLFDGYAVKFDSSLIQELSYQAPLLLSELIQKYLKKNEVEHALDLGCGTGLLGKYIKGFCRKLTGIDLSQNMLGVAMNKGIYDDLVKANIVDYLCSKTLIFDLIVAADVFIYVGDLTRTFQLIRSRNKKSGLFAFCTEYCEGEPFKLEKTGRYSHSHDYITSLCSKFGYEIEHFSVSKLRKEHDMWLKGGYYILSFRAN